MKKADLQVILSVVRLGKIEEIGPVSDIEFEYPWIATMGQRPIVVERVALGAEVLRSQAARMLEEFALELWVGNKPVQDVNTCAAAEPVTIVDDFAAISEYIRNRPPAPRSIWFIDRQGDYYQFAALAERRRHTVDKEPLWGRPVFQYSLYGLPIHNWTVADIESKVREILQDPSDDGDQLREWLREGKLFPFWQPGIWVEMSDGNHIRIQDTW